MPRMNVRLWISFVVIAVGFALTLFWHLSIGTQSVSFSEVFQALTAFDEDNFTHLIIRELRLPRALVAITVGASLAVSGAVMQGVTRNPLADPSLLGMMSGGALAVVIFMSSFGQGFLVWVPVVAAVGAAISAIIVWTTASRTRGGASPLSLILAGSAYTAFTVALLSLFNLFDERTFEQMRVWLVGSLVGSNIESLAWCLPWVLLGLVGAIVLSPTITAMSMGEHIATGLGINVNKRRWQLLVCVVVLTAASVALAGPLGFIGLVIPHVVRILVGSDYRVIIPCSIVVGAGYLLIVDSLARYLIQPQEIATGLITVLLGTPLFVLLVKVKVR